MLVALGAGMFMSSCSKDDGISAEEVKTIVAENSLSSDDVKTIVGANSLSAEQIKDLVEKNLMTNDQIEGFIKTHSLTKEQIITLIQSNSLTEDQLKEAVKDLCTCTPADVITDEEIMQILVDFHKYVADTEFHTVDIDDLDEYIYNWHSGPICKLKITGLEKFFLSYQTYNSSLRILNHIPLMHMASLTILHITTTII